MKHFPPFFQFHLYLNRLFNVKWTQNIFNSHLHLHNNFLSTVKLCVSSNMHQMVDYFFYLTSIVGPIFFLHRIRMNVSKKIYKHTKMFSFDILQLINRTYSKAKKNIGTALNERLLHR